ncbi:MAG: NAD(P)H-dependent oxidoreductase [Ilumatobacteraceae bacterium]
MTTILHISASPRGPKSESLALATDFLDTYTATHDNVTVDTLDLWDGSLPTFGFHGASAKMNVFGGSAPEGDEIPAWAQARSVYDRFAAADNYLFSVPMWNNGVPYVLKQWIDIVTQPGWVFGFTPTDGYTGLVAGKKAAVVYTSGVYGPGAAPAFGTDYHSTFFNEWLRFIGIDDITEIRFQPSILTATPDADRALASDQARDAAKRF